MDNHAAVDCQAWQVVPIESDSETSVESPQPPILLQDSLDNSLSFVLVTPARGKNGFLSDTDDENDPFLPALSVKPDDESTTLISGQVFVENSVGQKPPLDKVVQHATVSSDLLQVQSMHTKSKNTEVVTELNSDPTPKPAENMLVKMVAAEAPKESHQDKNCQQEKPCMVQGAKKKQSVKMGRNKKGNTRKWRRRNVIIGTPRQDNVPSNTPSQGTLSSSTPSQKNLSNSTPSQENLSNSTPSQGNLSNSTPSQGNLSNSTPSQGNLSNSTPSQGNLSNSTPSQRKLSSNTSGQNARSHSSPEDNFKKSAPVHELSLKETVKRKYCKTFQTEEGMLIGKLSMTVDHKDEVNKVQKLSIGTPTNSPTKVILLVGATGTGKTTLINAMVNYILRVDFEDDFRFILVDDVDSDRSEAQSQTDYITAFSFHHLPGMPFEYSYVLIDTPGFGDTRGITRDRQMLTQIEMFLKQDYGIDQVDGVGFVIPASATRLTQTQRYVYEGLASIFGKNIKDNIFIMATFADARKPPVLAAIKEAKMCHGDVYKFNNSALYARNTLEGLSQSSDSDGDDDDVSMSAQYWDMAQRNMNNFFTKLGQTFPSSLTLTKEVLEERRYLQTVLTGLQQQIHLGLSKLSNLNKEKDMLARLDDEMRGCMDHYVNVDVPKIEKINLKPEECVTNCMKCSFTCHYPCFLPKNVDKLKCASMKNGMCKVCPALCPFDVHFHMEFRFLITHVTEFRTVQELLNRYQNASVGKTLKEKIIQAIQDDIVNHSKLLLSMIKQVQGHVERLEEIALKPNPLSTTEYIELMIESEKMQRLPNFEQRINMLLKLKEEVSILNLAKDVSANTQLSGEALLKHFQNLMIK